MATIDLSMTRAAKSAKETQKFLLMIEEYAFRRGIAAVLSGLILRYYWGVKVPRSADKKLDNLVYSAQELWFKISITELQSKKERNDQNLRERKYESLSSQYQSESIKIFQHHLSERFGNLVRKRFEIHNLKRRSKEFLSNYPVVLSTTFSLKNSLSKDTIYDYIVVDEASQVDIVTGILSLSASQKAVIVGDLKQLPHVVGSKEKSTSEEIFSRYQLDEHYRYADNSLLQLAVKKFPEAARTFLREHYRCQPEIIEFCNKKFYENQLIVLTKKDTERIPLVAYRTEKANIIGSVKHLKNINQRQIDVLEREVIPEQRLIPDIDFGVITPYRNQANAIKKRMSHLYSGLDIPCDTVHKFQGRENDIIVISTVDNSITPFSDNPNMINVAVSRAKKQLILLVTAESASGDGNIADLLRWIEYNNYEVHDSSVASVFDCLFAASDEARQSKMRKWGSVSKYPTENLMYGLIRDILKIERFSRFDVAVHVPLLNIIKNFDGLSDDETKYAKNPWTHVDFLIYDRFSKQLQLAVEVDGVTYHALGTAQSFRDAKKDSILNRYSIPLLRFKTNGSEEQNQLLSALDILLAK